MKIVKESTGSKERANSLKIIDNYTRDHIKSLEKLATAFGTYMHELSYIQKMSLQIIDTEQAKHAKIAADRIAYDNIQTDRIESLEKKVGVLSKELKNAKKEK